MPVTAFMSPIFILAVQVQNLWHASIGIALAGAIAEDLHQRGHQRGHQS
jgi:hypothetical protein